MSLIGILLVVLFVIVSILLILIVLVQNEEGDSLGGIFAGGSSSAFGSRSGNVLTKTTYILGTVFLLTSFGLALVNRTPSDSGVESAAKQATSGAQSEWWSEQPASPAADAPLAPATEAPAQPAE